MLSDEIRTRLGQLHRPQVPLVSPRATSSGHVHWRPLAAADVPACTAADPFEQALEVENRSGKHLRFRAPLAALWPQAGHHPASSVSASVLPHDARHEELAAVAEHFPAGALFLDLETCGFAGSPIFLIGLVWQADEGLVLDQLFARNYAEERALLDSLWQIAAGNRVLVTFNGKSFDWPMVHDRSTRHHLGQDKRREANRASSSTERKAPLGRRDARPELLHCDLLHHARRRWKRVLPDCKLQTLERYVCRRSRRDDLPGALVPAAYHEFVRTGERHQLPGILQHNAWDLVTLVELALRLAAN